MESSIHIGALGIYPLGLALGAGFLTAGVVGRGPARRYGLAPDAWWRLVVGAMIVAVIGARVGFVVGDWEYYARRPLELWLPPLDGLSLYGGFYSGIVFLAVIARRLRRPFWELADLVALPYVTGALVISLIWNTPVFLAGTAPWLAVTLDTLYLTGLYAVLWWLWAHRRGPFRPGVLFLGAVAGDALLQLVIGSVAVLVSAHPWGALATTHALRAFTALAAAGLFFARGGSLQGILPGDEPFRRPLSRWVMWLVAYGVLFSLTTASRALVP